MDEMTNEVIVGVSGDIFCILVNNAFKLLWSDVDLREWLIKHIPLKEMHVYVELTLEDTTPSQVHNSDKCNTKEDEQTEGHENGSDSDRLFDCDYENDTLFDEYIDDDQLYDENVDQNTTTGQNLNDDEVTAQSHQCDSMKEVHEQIVISAPASVPTYITSPISNPRSDSTLGGMTVDNPSFEQVVMTFGEEGCISRLTSEASCNPNFMPDGFSNGPKKPRTEVQYTLPLVSDDFRGKQEMHSSRSLPCKRIKRASLTRISDGSGNNQKNLELLTCFANVLVTHGDKGWRECGAHIVLEVADHNEWRLVVKLSEVTKYSYKVKHILQPGSTNRYSHAMIWKWGKDWVLEFPDRSQWMLFKEMFEECYNRNIHAASVKNIPIPGVLLVEENDDYGDDVPFFRNSTMYFRQVQTDAEMAMDPSRNLYDMDSDDEQWLMAHKNCADKHKYEEISEEFLEIAIDMFEKVSYALHRDKFTDDDIEDLASGIGSVEAAKLIYQHWRRRREKMGMPLIRHLKIRVIRCCLVLTSSWERYQRQPKEWEPNVGSQEKVSPPEKPPMFAFCLKPRGLDVPNKGSKQRYHRKLPVSGNHHASSWNRHTFDIVQLFPYHNRHDVYLHRIVNSVTGLMNAEAIKYSSNNSNGIAN
ncbi:hypothetical protein DH2020_046800 [Rehmannia glutinosa]|uniref:Enhancer of polycomb-like protein n=1 Tax=Rehmannia glutinosa TaxID=99300 RepID=A0ABR0UA62_REHGL